VLSLMKLMTPFRRSRQSGRKLVKTEVEEGPITPVRKQMNNARDSFSNSYEDDFLCIGNPDVALVFGCVVKR
jgi:hypothetical protein